MRIPILLLLSIACCFAGCATKPAIARLFRPPSPPPATNAEPVMEPEIVGTLPDPSKTMSDADLAELRQRLGRLRKGMTREKALDILNLSSFGVRVTSHAGEYGVTYYLERGHKLTLAVEAGSDAFIFRWADFDGELWPENPNLPIQRPAPRP